VVYLLDTNIVSDLVRAPQGRAASRVVTDNEREFARVTGLRCENWLR
jgi:predicted nucleic acid-binding protein